MVRARGGAGVALVRVRGGAKVALVRVRVGARGRAGTRVRVGIRV